MLEVIERVNRELGTTTALITHNAGIAAMADRVLHMGSGRMLDEQRHTERVAPGTLQW